MKQTIYLMLVEDHPEYRETITLALEKETDIELVSQFGTAEEALHCLQNTSTRNAPDLILLDLNLPGMSGIEAIPHFTHRIPNTKIVVLTQSNKEADVFAAISAGAAGYLLKGITRYQLFEGIRTVMDGGALLDPEVATYILRTFKTPSHKTETGKILTEREIEILALIAEGLVQKQIADQLNISIHTVIDHIRHIYGKLNVQNAPAAVNRAHRLGLFPSDG